MKKILSLVGLIAALILAGCGSPVIPDPSGMDWCYTIDFRGSQRGFSLGAGQWVEGVGLRSDDTGLLQISYDYGQFVQAYYVAITATRPSAGDYMNVTAAGDVFGISASYTNTLPPGLGTGVIEKTADTVGIQGSSVNITVDADAIVEIQSILIHGMGASPFPDNSCDHGTSTPFPGEPTTTATATGTPSATATGTLATPTPGDAAQCEFDFSISMDNWDGLYGGGGTYAVYDTGVGWGRGTLNARIAISHEFAGVEINAITINFDQVFTGHLNILDADGLIGFATEYDRSGSSWTVTELTLEDGIGLNIFDDSSTAPADLRVVSITLISDDCEVPLTTPTPGPTNTPGPTRTPDPLWDSCVDFRSSAYTFIGVNTEYANDSFDRSNLGFEQQDTLWSIGRSGLNTRAKKKIKLEFDHLFEGSIRLSDNGTNETDWHVIAGNPIIADFSGETWIPTTTLWIEFDNEEIDPPLTLQRLCWVDEFPATNTPIPGTGTPLYTRTPLPTTTVIAPSRTPINIPAPIIYITATSGVYITTTPIYGGTGVYYPTPIGSATPYGTPAGEGEGFGSGGGGFGDVGDMLGFGWDIGWGLLGAMLAYLGQATNIVTGLLSAFANATPQAIPGLPLCITNPMGYDICAIYYIMDNTFFAPATPGQYIVPLLQIVFNILIAILFVRWVLRIIRRGEKITHVQ